MQFAAIVVAAGRGLRAGGDVPKQYQMLAGMPVLRRTAAMLLAHPVLTHLCVVIHPEDSELCHRALHGLSDPRLMPPVCGGANRADSVRAGLEALVAIRGDLLTAPVPGTVLIHDAARPLTPRHVIDAVLDALAIDPGALPALPVVDALWSGSDGLASAPRPREGLWRAQTPQGFRLADILAAHRAHRGPADDDVAIARAAGLTVAITAGAEENFKITAREDFARAERLLEDKMDIRTGNGFDVHRFRDGPGVTLCGVHVPHDKALEGHSDADVAMHAVTDALFGALAEGDIGQWFPPSEARWKGAASQIFLEKAAERVAARAGRITHVDCTIICEAPKIGPHAEAMRARLAQILQIEKDRVSVKATTSERLGFTGRGEGIAAMATATVVLP
ncbi:bifunctional 2-C-methyl-D-erythritol 4-phosphate cytidylyltransferase/2-C-methyl-D-erythritol 2,4-cyclodiphosphate synthase [Paroceanicella profunda]|uniref:Bifunctional enzyme IspD/IspF n=1 Tax=Paroceanicella profunda TaxID=2579971 RepID=A0A5B8FWL0_9RHOB|nr:bifunctional 2-C-methyl-D-erythritol 4-phosphate cytidylyltransferase/2-C-methyl-D-erythritol 2,4-cyclodiphosphate synthase [Paroceanicella profunda]QDL92895.1 bifunctional 2-C-methyl-D-erythritol 4-phosphate cytidylyltransferase/2-C-methyl-D-erythritol 2,4-cyclodiphosphate synthase [Paroceanicella profunda]